MRTTVNINIPYPEDLDAPRSFPTQVAKPAAELIDREIHALKTATEDSGWIQASMGSLFQAGQIFLRKIGPTVFMRGKFVLKAGGNLSAITYGSAVYIPEGYRPLADAHFSISGRNPSVDNGSIRPQANLEVLPAGRANLHIHQAGLDMALPGYCSWVVG